MRIFLPSLQQMRTPLLHVFPCTMKNFLHLPVYPVDDLIDNLLLVSVPPVKVPFVGSDLTGFSLSAVGAAVGLRLPGDSAESKEEAL